MTDVAAFVLARLAEDEQAARAAGSGEWRRDGISSVEDADGRLVVYGDGPAPSGGQADHIALHDPARVLAEVAALRRLQAYAEGKILAAERAASRGEYFGAVTTGDVGDKILELLAGIWKDHPDYDPAWKVET